MGFKLASLFVDVTAKTEPAEAKLQILKGKLAALAQTRFSLPGGGFTAALGIGAGTAAITKMISGASELSETLSKVDVTFGKSSGVVKKFAEDMARDFGLPKREMLDAASMFGLIMTGAGMAEDKAADMSVKMAKLAADCSSFYNVPVAEALEKIRAGMTGEAEPLKAFGVMLDEDTVKAKALQMGLAKGGKELDNAAKITARLAIIQEKAGKASGDLERTQGGAANQARKFAGTLQNLGDTLGTVVLPAATAAIQLFNEMATDLSHAAEAGTGAWSGFVETLSGAIDTAGVIYRNFGDIIERTGVMIGGYVTEVAERWMYRFHVMAEGVDWFARVFGEQVIAIGNMAKNLGDNMIAIFREVWDYLRSGGKDPIELKLQTVFDGGGYQMPEFRMPELKLSSVDNQLAELDAKILAREQAHTDAKAKGKADADAKAKGAAAAGAIPGAGGSKSSQAGVTDADAYARDLQEAALKAGKDKADPTTKAVEDQTKTLGAKLDLINRAVARTGGAKFQRG